MNIKEKKHYRFLFPLTKNLKVRIYEMAKNKDCSMTELITSMIEHCLSEMEKDL